MGAFLSSWSLRSVPLKLLRTIGRILCVITWLVCFALSPTAKVTAQTDTATAAAPTVPEATASQTITVPGMQVPNGLAVDPVTHRVYITSRDNDRLIMLDGFKYTVLGQAAVGDSPWGVAVDSDSKRVYVADYSSGDLRILTADTLTPVATVPIGADAQLTNVATANQMGRALVVSHRNNRLYVVNGQTGAVEASQATGGDGAWGVAFDPNLYRAYVSHRDSATVTVLDGLAGWAQISSQTVRPCGGSGGQPYGLGFNPYNQRLYIACAPSGNVNVVKIYTAASTGLSFLASINVGSGGDNGGGGIAVNTQTGNVWFTNSTSHTVSVINSTSNQVIATWSANQTPFGAAVDPITGKVYVGNKTSNNLTVLDDTYPADPSMPAITLSKQSTCTSDQITVTGRHFPPYHAQIYFNGVLQGTWSTQNDGTFTGTFTVPANPGGMQTVTAGEMLMPSQQVGALVRTPLPDLPIIFLPGLAGTTLLAGSDFRLTAPVNLALCLSLKPTPSCLLPEEHFYQKNEPIWVGQRTVAEAFLGHWRYMDAIALESDGETARKDVWKKRPDIVLGGPLWDVAGLMDVYTPLDRFLKGMGYVEDVTLFYFPFDWRKDYIHMDQALDDLINRALQKSGKDKVILMAHSTGGVVARNYLLRRGAAKVDQLITMGTPYIGAPIAARSMEVGDDMGLGRHLGDFGIGLSPEESKSLAQNFAGLYDLLPSALWFTPSPADYGAAPPAYLVRSREEDKQIILEALDYAQSTDYLRRHRNEALLNNALTFQNQGIGDLSRLTDQYFSQRIASTGRMTPATIEYSPRETCSHWQFFGWHYTCVPLPELAFAYNKPFGDDGVPLRSAIGGNLAAGDNRYYIVNNVEHMKLPGDPNVHLLLLQMLDGSLCSGGGLSASVQSVEEVSGSEITLIGTAALNIYDAAGNHAGPLPDQPAGIENHLPGVDYSPGTDSVIATIMAGGPYTVTVTGTALNGAALLRVSPINAGEIDQTMVYAGIPITGTTEATLTLAGPGQAPSPLTVRYLPSVPPETNNGTLLTGTAAEDLTPPLTTMKLNSATQMVTVTADDGAGGSGVASIMVSSENPPVNYTTYSGPFRFPGGVGCVWAVALDQAGNASLARAICRTWLPLIRK